MIEQLIERFISEGLITREEIDKQVADAKRVSPVNDLNNIANIEAMQMQLIDQLGVIVGDLMMKVARLEEEKTNA